jgi:single-strand DNA-binding protein
MRDTNYAVLIGSVGQDPELKTSPTGKAMVRSSLATNFRWKDKQSGEIKSEVEWHTLMLWEEAAEQFAATIRKGDRVYVKGAIHYNEYTRPDGTKIPQTQIKVEDFGKMVKPEKAGGEKSTGYRKPSRDDASDIPF